MRRKNPGDLGINFEVFFDQGARRAHFTQYFRKPNHRLACARRNAGQLIRQVQHGGDKTEERGLVVAQANRVHLRQRIERGGGFRFPRRIEGVRGRQLIDDWIV